MARIVLDSNLIARAVMSPGGLASEILRKVLLEDHVLCMSDFMFAELLRILQYPRLQKMHGLTDLEVVEFVCSIQKAAMVVEFDPAEVAKVTRDIDDDPIIETALVAKAQFLCSLDRDILDQAVISYCESHGVQVVDDVAMIGFLRRTDAK